MNELALYVAAHPQLDCLAPFFLGALVLATCWVWQVNRPRR